MTFAAPAVTFEEAFKTGTAGSITYAEGEAVPKERMQAEVQKVLDRAVAEGRQGAVQFCVYIDGECVVDAWAGTYATNSTRKIDGDSLFPIYSTEKQLLVTAAHRAHERGLLDYEKPVKSYWPEFTGSPEKEALTVRELMGHRAGLPSALPKGTALADRTNWNYKVEWFAKQPAKDPGKVSRYLSGSFGVYLGHVLERVYGKPIKEILDEEAIVPAGIARDFFFASGPEEDGRIVTVYNGSEPWSFEKMNETPFRRAIDPAGWAVSSARGIARFYNRLCGFDGQPPLIRPETLDFALRPNRWEGEPVTPEINDKWIMVWGLGYGLWGDDQNLSSVFGQGGLGGSEGMCDRRRRICIGYTCNVSANYDGFNKITPELFRIVGFQTRYTRKGAAERPAPLGVTDRRFALSCSNDSGCSGAKLNRMSMPESEHIQRICDVFPYCGETGAKANLVSDAGTSDRYTTFSLWDTFRAAHPLYTILTPEVVAASLRSVFVGLGGGLRLHGRELVPARAVVLAASNYNSFTIIAKGLSKKNKYVKSVKLNGHELENRILRHADILKGGELVFEMKGKAK